MYFNAPPDDVRRRADPIIARFRRTSAALPVSEPNRSNVARAKAIASAAVLGQRRAMSRIAVAPYSRQRYILVVCATS